MILDDIVANTRLNIERKKSQIPLKQLEREIESCAATRSFMAAIAKPGINIIAEVKKASPSRGLIRAEFDPLSIAQIYAENGAAAISVVTEETFFQGKLSYLTSIREVLARTCPPLLRKDFIIDAYQLFEARVAGADAVLLIVSILTIGELKVLLKLAHELGMAALAEVHDEKDLEVALDSGAKIIGINNRDLKSFKVDLKITERLCPLVPGDRIVVSESGIVGREDVLRLKSTGINAVLVGEALMASSDIAGRFKEMIG